MEISFAFGKKFMLKNFKQRKPIGRGLGTWQNEGNLPYPK
jgi:hypothetical protein